MNPDQIIQLARQAGFLTGSYTNGTDERPFVHPVSESNCLVEITKLIELVRADKQEQCAVVCDAEGNVDAAFCAQAIRALKD